jgi:hypothetical protein
LGSLCKTPGLKKEPYMKISDAALRQLITTKADLPAASLGLRILVNRLRIQTNANPGLLDTALSELRDFVARNPSAQTELASI